MSATCRSCSAPIIWAEHARTGNRMPLDEIQTRTGVRFRIEFTTEPPTAHLVPTDGAELGHPSHFGSCPNANKHRRSR